MNALPLLTGQTLSPIRQLLLARLAIFKPRYVVYANIGNIITHLHISRVIAGFGEFSGRLDVHRFLQPLDRFAGTQQ